MADDQRDCFWPQSRPASGEVARQSLTQLRHWLCTAATVLTSPRPASAISLVGARAISYQARPCHQATFPSWPTIGIKQQLRRTTSMIDLYNYSLLSISSVGLFAILLAIEAGHRLGVHVGPGDDNVSTLEGAVIGLLALMVGFTFAMALSRFEARRDAVLTEANAIGTTALRARLLPEPQRKEALSVLKEYVKIRLDITQRPVTNTELAAAIQRSSALQEALWQQAMAVAAADKAMVPTGIFIQTLNEMIDNQEKRSTALRNRVPNIVVSALFCIAITASAFSGYASGLETRRSRLPVYVTGLVVWAVILLIIDLDRPSAGFIEVSQQPMIDTAATIAAFPD